MLEILEQGIIHINLRVSEVDDRTGLPLRPAIADVVQPVILAEQNRLLLVAIAIPVENGVRASDMGTQRFRNLRRNDTELLED